MDFARKEMGFTRPRIRTRRREAQGAKRGHSGIPIPMKVLLLFLSCSSAYASSSCCPTPRDKTSCDASCCEIEPGPLQECIGGCASPPPTYPGWKRCVVAVGCSSECCELAHGSFEECMAMPCCQQPQRDTTASTATAAPVPSRGVEVSRTDATFLEAATRRIVGDSRVNANVSK